MNDNHNSIDKYFIEAFSAYEGERSARFKIKFHLMLIFLKFRALVLLLLFVSGIGIIGYLGYSFVNQPQVVEEVRKQPSEQVMYKPEEIYEESTLIPLLDRVIEHNQSETLAKNIPVVKSKSYDISSEEMVIPDRLLALNKIEFRYMGSLKVVQKPTFVFDKMLNSNISDTTTTPNEEEDSITWDSSSDSLSKKQFFSLSLYVSPDFTWQHLSQEGMYQKYIQLRKEQESVTFSWSAGADIQFHWNDWFAQVGLNYSRYKTKTNYDYQYEQLDSANSYFEYDTTWVWVYNPPNLGYPLMTGIDTVWVPVFQDVHVEYEGRSEWSYLEIPVLIGYQFGRTKVRFEVAAGVSVGFFMQVKGSVPRFPQMDGMVSLSDQSELINKTLWNGIVQVGISYQLTPRWHAMAQPYYKPNLHSVFDQNYSIKQKYSAVGIKFGFRYCF